MVNDGETQRRGVARRGPHDLLVRIPGAARDDPRRARSRQRAQGNALRTGCARTRRALGPLGRSCALPGVSSRETTTGCRPSSRRGSARTGPGRAGPPPRAQPCARRSTCRRRPRAQLNAAAAAPVHADEVERPLRAEGCGSPARSEREVAAPERRIGGVRGRRGREQKAPLRSEKLSSVVPSALSSFGLKSEAPAMVGCGAP